MVKRRKLSGSEYRAPHPLRKPRAVAALSADSSRRLRRQVVEKGKNPKPSAQQFYTNAPCSPAICIFRGSPLALSSFLFSFSFFFPNPSSAAALLKLGGSPQALAAAGDEPYIGRDEAMEGVNGVGGSESERRPLSEVVGDCVQRWFQDAYKEARKGDIANQVLVAQMFFSGYGTPKNEYKV